MSKKYGRPESVVDIFISLARIPSPSGKEDRVIRKVEEYASLMEGNIKRDNFGNVVVEFDEAFFSEDALSLSFCAHLDTVEPAFRGKVVVSDGYLSSEGKTVLGVDDKAGVASAIYGTWKFMLELKESKVKSAVRPYLLFTLQEEIGSIGARNFEHTLLPEGTFIYVLDGEGPVGTITLSAPYHYRWEISFYGKEAHAGVDPQKGVNAIVMLSKWITSLKWGLLRESLTANIGKIEGGRAMNIVPAQAKAIGEFRGKNPDSLEKLWKNYLSAAEKVSKKFGGEFDIKRELTFKGFSVSKTDPQVKLVINALSEMGISPVFVDSMGGSDANFLVEKFPVLVLGIGGENFHSPEERIKIEQLEKCGELIYRILKVASARSLNHGGKTP